MKRFYFLNLIIPIAILLGWNLNAIAQTSTFNYTGAVQTYNIPAGVSQIGIDAIGGCGGGGYVSSGSPGPVVLGGRVQCTMNVTPGTSLYIYVGQAGQTDGSGAYTPYGGWNGGMPGQAFSAGGGGATDIRLTNSAVGTYTTTNRVVVAGGGGGGGDWGATGGKGGGLTGANGVIYSVYLATGGTQTSGGTQSYSSAYNATIGSGGPSGGSGGGGSGGYYGGAGGYNGGGGGGGSSYTDPTAVISVVHTQGYSGANGNGQVIITVLCSSPGVITGNPGPMCAGATATLTNTAGSGTWSSSNTAVASINSSGLVTAVQPGTATITYTVSNPCGALATTIITVSPTPSALPATSNVCQYGTVTLTDTASGGTWATSNAGSATVSGGIVTGGTPGTATISYTLPSGCSTSSFFTVKPAPAVFNITGGGAFCVGGTGVPIGVAGSNTGNNYALTLATSTVSSIPGTGASLSYGLITTAGSYSVIATNTTSGCSNTMTGVANVTVNPLPAAITGVMNVCVGATTTLTDPTPGGTWTTSNPGQASIGLGSGIVTGITASAPAITYTMSGTGCIATAPFVVNGSPAPITGSSNVCVSGSTTLADVTPGGTWSSAGTAIATVGAGSGMVTGVTPGTTSITYTSSTGCSVSALMNVNPLPLTYSLTGGGSYCAGGTGVHVGLSYSNTGVTYQLYNGVTPIIAVGGSNSGLDFGLQTGAGTYTVIATNTITGCSSTMPGSVVINILAAPAAFNVIGGGSYCAGGTGVTVGLDGSGTGIKYQLYNGATPVGSLVSGTGSPISFGLHTGVGIYTVIATNTVTGCTALMNGAQSIAINPLPVPYTVSGGGSYCTGGAGVDITLTNSDFGVTYQLIRSGSGAVSTISSSGGLIDFGLFTLPGIYTVTATDGLTCTNTMSGSAVIVVNPLPVIYNVIGGGNYCSGGAGSHVGLNFSSVGINYQLYNGGPVPPLVPGSGTSLDFGAHTAPGVYTVVATNPITNCSNNMAGSAIIGINPLPNAYNVTGGGNYCFGTSGSSIGTDFSDIGVNYQLFKGVTPVGAPVAGTGALLNFGLFTTAGTYTVVATNVLTGCSIALTGSAVVGIIPLPVVHTVTGGGNYCTGDTGVHVMLNASDIGIDYQLLIGGSNIGSPVHGTGSGIDFGLQTAGIYTVVGKNTATLCQNNMSGSATIHANPKPAVFNMTGGGPYCSGGTGTHVGLDGSATGISYQLFNGGSVGSPMSGSGGPVDFGLKTVIGSYTAWATNVLTGCKIMMNGVSAVTINPLPADYAVTGGGNRCAADPGLDIDLLNSDIGFEYQLYLGVSPVGSAVAGTGSAISLGLQTAAGVYTVIAKDLSTLCTKRMPGSASINIVIPAVYTVTGGGNYCAGGTGVDVCLSGSAISESYQLLIDGVPTGSPVSGTGASICFGLQTAAGVYRVVATNILYGCVANMTGSVSVGINPLPGIFNIAGGGSYCAGGTGLAIGLDGSNTAIQYQLFNGPTAIGLPLTGTGSPLSYGMFTSAGTYTVKAVNPATTCRSDMAGSRVITVIPLPAVYTLGIENNGYYCAANPAGVHIYVGGSDIGVNYTLYRGAALIGTTPGTGAVLDLGNYLIGGTYTVVASDTGLSGCSSNMAGSVTVTIVPLPIVHNITGGGDYCPGAAGVHIGLNASDVGIKYTLHRIGVPSDTTTIYGTGLPLDYGLRDSTGTYMVVGTSDPARLTGCVNNMSGTATVTLDAILTPTVTVVSFPAVGLGVWHIDSLHANVLNGGPHPTYQWYINGNIIAGETNSSFKHHIFYNNDIVSCQVTASGPCGGNANSGSFVIILQNVGVKVLANQGDVKLIPNPNKGMFTVKGNLGIPIAIGTDEEVNLEVTNMLGQVLYSGKANAHNGDLDQRIELNNLANGMYMLNLRSTAGNAVFHFVIEQ